MLDHPITVVLNVFGHWKATGLNASKFMSIQNQEEHIGHVKQLKSDRYQDRTIYLSLLSRSFSDHYLRCGGWLNLEFSKWEKHSGWAIKTIYKK